MEQKNVSISIADAEAVGAIRDFLSDWYSVAELFETTANAASSLLELAKGMTKEEHDYVCKLIDQHVMLANLLKPFEKKGGEA